MKIKQNKRKGGSHSGVVANELDCDLIVNEFKLQLYYYIHFQTKTLGKGMIVFTLQVIG